MSSSPIRIVERQRLQPAPPPGGVVQRVRVAPDGRTLAFTVLGGDAPGIHVQGPSGPSRHLVRTKESPAVDLAWSPDGTMVAYLLSSDDSVSSDRSVGWASAAPGDAEGGAELGRMRGSTFAWSPGSDAVLVFCQDHHGLWRHGVKEGVAAPVGGPVRDDGDPRRPARIVPSADGRRIALATRRMFDDRVTVTLFGRKEDAWETEVLTDIPGAGAEALPFWSPKGMTVMLLVVHPGLPRSGMVAFRDAADDGQIVYRSDLPDALEAPAWARSGRLVLFFRAVNEEPMFPEIGSYRLSALDVETRRVLDVGEPGEMEGTPRFLDGKTLVVDGGRAAHVLTLGSGG